MTSSICLGVCYMDTFMFARDNKKIARLYPARMGRGNFAKISFQQNCNQMKGMTNADICDVWCCLLNAKLKLNSPNKSIENENRLAFSIQTDVFFIRCVCVLFRLGNNTIKLLDDWWRDIDGVHAIFHTHHTFIVEFTGKIEGEISHLLCIYHAEEQKESP